MLTEVEMTCNRVIIINKGRILASDTPENLVKTLHAGGLINVEIRGPASEVAAKLRDIAGVTGVETRAGNDEFVSVSVEPQAGTDPREGIFKAVATNGWTLRELVRDRTSLEDIFVQVMREEDEAEEERRESRRGLR